MGEITVFLDRLNQGDQTAMDELVPLVYQELRARAAFYLSGQNKGHTLQATALVNEAFLKLIGQDARWKTSRHFYNAASEVMRQILVSHARAKNALKRGGAMNRLALEDVADFGGDDSVDWEALDAALIALRAADLRRYQIVMLRYFSGLTDSQVAKSLDISEKTVRRDWVTAKIFLRERMQNRLE